MSASMKVFAPIMLGAMFMVLVTATDASAALRLDPGLTINPNAEASVEKVWWHRHWHRRYSYRYHWHWHRSWHRW